jgi:hypothetical protein
MLLHLGGDWAANSRRVIAILDYSTVSGSRSCKRLLADATAKGLLERIDEIETRSMILLSAERGTRVVLSPISASALKGRLQSNAVYMDFPLAAKARKAIRKGR